MRIEVMPELLKWACERAGSTLPKLAKRLPQLVSWEIGKVKPTLKQIEQFAKIVHIPVGFLFLKKPPKEQLPIPDFRTIGNKYISLPSPDLLETIYLCQQRQEWYHDNAKQNSENSLSFVGSAKITDDIKLVAHHIRHTLGFNIEMRGKMGRWEDALRHFIQQADEIGILVMVNGVVGSNNKRKLEPKEFRGFALADTLAPLVFINGADTKSAQMFTLAHELAHIWLGESGVSDIEPVSSPINSIERWCNQVAAEILVPLSILQIQYKKNNGTIPEAGRLARYFKVSTLVILRRIYDAGYLTQIEFWQIYQDELDRLLAIPRLSGGNYYLTQASRLSKRFAKALIISTLEGQTLHRDAFRMLGLSKFSTFEDLGHSLKVT